MRTIDPAEILIEDRQRKEVTSEDVQELRVSIEKKGLLHAIVLSKTADGGHKLLAGERRLTAMRGIIQDKSPLYHDGDSVPIGQVPYVYIGDLSAEDLLEAELEENILRKKLSWQEEMEAKAKIHEARLTKNPDHTQIDTAREIAERTERSVDAERRSVRHALILTQHKDDPVVKEAPNERVAFQNLLKKMETKFKATLAEKSVEENNGKSTHSHELHAVDCQDYMKTIPDATFDVILTDPPYGIDAHIMDSRSTHHYDDTEENALRVAQAIIAEGVRITKTRATLFMFCDSEHFITLRDYAEAHAWTTWRTPLIWTKGLDGSAPWGSAGFTRTYETILFAVKGAKELHRSGGPDVLYYKRPDRRDRQHGAEKPVDLLEYLLSISTFPGDSVFDPCAGSGSILPAAHKRKVKAVVCENNPDYYTLCMARLTDLPKQEVLPDEIGLTEVDILIGK